MISTLTMKLLMVIYTGIILESLYERNFNRAEYWLGALLITHSILALK